MYSDKPEPEFLTPGEVAEALRVDPKTVSRWVQRKKLPAIKTPGGHARIKREAFLLMMKGLCPFCGTEHPASSGCAA